MDQLPNCTILADSPPLNITVPYICPTVESACRCLAYRSENEPFCEMEPALHDIGVLLPQ